MYPLREVFECVWMHPTGYTSVVRLIQDSTRIAPIVSVNMESSMNGIVKKVVAEKGFGFIKANEVEYFFHRSDYSGYFDDLCEDLMQGKQVEVTFEMTASPKGPRAKDVVRVDGGV